MLLSNLYVTQTQRRSETLYVFLFTSTSWWIGRVRYQEDGGCRQIWRLEMDIRLKDLLAWLVFPLLYFLVSDFLEEVK